MNNSKTRFALLINQFNQSYPLLKLFDDFLTVAICKLSPNPVTKRSNYGELLQSILKQYANDPKIFLFDLLFQALMIDTKRNISTDDGTDILGSFFMENFKGEKYQRDFMPWDVCLNITSGVSFVYDKNTSQSVFDPHCGSGRFLLALYYALRNGRTYFGMEHDQICAKMAAVTLFINGVKSGEIVCADVNIPGDFKVAYRLSSHPFGIFIINTKEDSELWKLVNSEGGNMHLVNVTIF